MINVFSQKINKDGIDYLYNCSVDENNDLVCFTYKSLDSIKGHFETLDYFEIDFPTLREFMLYSGGEFASGNYLIKDGFDYYRLFNIDNNLKILLPKMFLIDTYQILNEMWVDD
jgi:hypothetical protein